MSILDEISAAVKAGHLFQVPSSIGLPVERRLVVSTTINKLLAGPWDDQPGRMSDPAKWKTRCVALEVDLALFVHGDEIEVSLPDESNPYEDHPDAYLRLLHEWDDEVWEIRSKFSPQLRLFGRFAAPDWFIALLWEYRANLGKPPWPQIGKCKSQWASLFTQPPYKGTTIHDYVTSNAVPC